MKRGRVREWLETEGWSDVFAAVIRLVCASPWAALLVWAASQGGSPTGITFLLVGGFLLMFLFVGYRALRVLLRGLELLHGFDLSELRTLGRFGPPWVVLNVIEAELVSGQRVVELGVRGEKIYAAPRRFGPNRAQVLLTPTWLLVLSSLPGQRVRAMRLADLHRLEYEFNAKSWTAVLSAVDGSRLALYADEATVKRLIAELLPLVPEGSERPPQPRRPSEAVTEEPPSGRRRGEES